MSFINLLVYYYDSVMFGLRTKEGQQQRVYIFFCCALFFPDAVLNCVDWYVCNSGPVSCLHNIMYVQTNITVSQIRVYDTQYFFLCLLLNRTWILSLHKALPTYNFYNYYKPNSFWECEFAENWTLRVVISWCRWPKIHENNFIRSFHNVAFALRWLCIF